MNFMLKNSTVNALDALFAEKDQMIDFVIMCTRDPELKDLFESEVSKKFLAKKIISFLDDNDRYSDIKQISERLADNKNFDHLLKYDNSEMLVDYAQNAKKELVQVLMSLYLQ